MSGESNLSKDAAVESIRRITLKAAFQTEVAQIRLTFGIPLMGFVDKNMVRAWRQSPKWQSAITFEFVDEIERLLAKYKLTPSFDSLLSAFITTNSFDLLYDAPSDTFSCEVEGIWVAEEFGTITENKWSKGQTPYARVYIPNNISLESAQKFLQRQWPYMCKHIFGKQLGKKSIRRSRNAERDKLICSYYERSREKLGLTKGQYRDLAVARILREQYGYKKVNREIVRIVAHRQKLLRDN